MTVSEKITSCYVPVGRFEAYAEEKAKGNKGANILPVSCTVYTVKDSMNSITDSWAFLAHAVKGGAGVAIDLSNIRAEGIVGRGGMRSLGVCNWLSVYSEIVNKVRQGRAGAKKGAGLLFLNASHPDLVAFLETPRSEIPDVSRAVYLTDKDLENPVTVQAILSAMAKGNIFLSKIVYNAKGERLYCNLCTEVLIKSQMTCILGQVNLGMVRDLNDIPDIFNYAFTELANKRDLAVEDIKANGYYLDPDDDKQVGLGVIGLANLLARFDISYGDFVKELRDIRMRWLKGLLISKFETRENAPAYTLALNLYRAYTSTSILATLRGFERAFAIAPTATVSYKNKDIAGFTTCPEISPPVCNSRTKKARRDSDAKTISVEYPLNVEVAGVDVSWETYDALVSEWQYMQNVGGLAHSISHNWWTTKPFSLENLKEFMSSNRVSSYYTYPVIVDVADKTDTIDEDLNTEALDEFWGGADEVLFDPNYCEACGG